MTHRKLTRLYCTVLVIGLASCGGSGSQSPADPPPPVNPVAILESALAEFPVNDYAVVIGDANGQLLAMEFGSFSADGQHLIASASKWLTAMVIMSQVELGIMNLDDRPQDYISWWTSDPADARSHITLEQLLSFTAGFDTDPDDDSCVSVSLTTLNLCAREFYDGGIAYEPGSTFHYGPAHMQVAARMAELAVGMSYTDLVGSALAPLGLTQTDFRVPSAANPRASGGGRSSANDYAKILQAILQGSFLSAVNDQLEIDRTGPPVAMGYSPAALVENNVDFRYALGHWRECAQSVWDASCDNRHVSSSTGAFGWHPWIDYDNGYYGVLAVFEASINGGGPGSASISFALDIQPLIVSALTDLRVQR